LAGTRASLSRGALRRRPGEIEGRVYQRHMGERLGKIAGLAARRAVVFLGQEAKVVSELQQPRKEPAGLVVAAQQVQAVGHPERTGQEGRPPLL
jgi:hypothetical protein